MMSISPVRRSQGAARERVEASLGSNVQGQPRPRIRGESHRRCRPVSEPAAERDRAERRREDVAHCPSKAALREHIDAYIAHWNDDPTPFIWTKPAASFIRSRKRMLDRISHAVHTAPLAKAF